MSAYVSIRQHTSAYVSIRQHTAVELLWLPRGKGASDAHRDPLHPSIKLSIPLRIIGFGGIDLCSIGSGSIGLVRRIRRARRRPRAACVLVYLTLLELIN